MRGSSNSRSCLPAAESFTAERDRRAGPDANPQKRGRISRELKAELHEAVNNGDD